MNTILIIDDVQTDRALAGKVVAESGNSPSYAVDGEDGIVKAKQLKPSLILLDVVMPSSDEFKTCRRLKADPDTAHIPVVLVTSKGTDSDKLWGRKQGADDLLVKPFSPDALLTIIRRYAR